MPPSKNPKASSAGVTPRRKGKAPLQRRGPKGYYTGSRKEFLESRVPAYTSFKKGNRQNFWHTLYTSWWLKYPWQLSDDDELPTDDPARMKSLALVGPGDQERKSKVEKQLTTRLTQWFSNRSSAGDVSKHSTASWLPVLQQLHRSQYPRPRQRTAIQQFMHDNPDTVNAAFVSQHADGKNLSKMEKMNLRYGLAKTMLSRQYSHLVPDLNKKAAAQHEADLEEWNMRLEGVSAAEDIPQARDSFFEAVHPLLQAIGTYADCYVSLIAGNPGADDTDNGFFTAVHWWPGDCDTTKDWTQWDQEAFNSGVAGPFLEYASETDRLLQAKVVTPPPALSPTLPGPVPIISDAPLADETPSAHTRTTAIAASNARYRPLPSKTTASIPTQGTNKRKHTTNPPPIRYFGDTESDDDDPGNFSGDGSSSGDSVTSSVAIRTKRQRTSRITTRSSTKTPAVDTDTDTPGPTGDSLDGITTTPINSSDPHPVNTSVNAMDIDDSLSDVISRGETLTSSDNDVPFTEAEEISNPCGLSTTDTAVPPATGPEVSVTTIAWIPADTVTELVAKAISSPRSSIVAPTTTPDSPPPPASPNEINMDSVPAFLLSHGKGKRKVDIFDYLNQVEDPHFRQVLLHYIHIEASDKSGMSGLLPTSNRPVEISQWSARARPAGLPDFTKGKRTFSSFVDSAFAWWGSIQPSWRSFKRGEVSRKVNGDWGVLYAPRINGLLNIVMLVYWWVGVLEEQKPKDGIRADYEEFADDVAWVFSNLSE